MAAILYFHDKLIWHVTPRWLSVFLSCVTNSIFVAAWWERLTFVSDVWLVTSCELTSGSIFDHVGISAWSCCIFISNYFVQKIHPVGDIQHGCHPQFWKFWEKTWDHPRRPECLGFAGVMPESCFCGPTRYGNLVDVQFINLVDILPFVIARRSYRL